VQHVCGAATHRKIRLAIARRQSPRPTSRMARCSGMPNSAIPDCVARSSGVGQQQHGRVPSSPSSIRSWMRRVLWIHPVSAAPVTAKRAVSRGGFVSRSCERGEREEYVFEAIVPRSRGESASMIEAESGGRSFFRENRRCRLRAVRSGAAYALR
jgi:hypothetical protein